jgi:glycosyltransferase involved in cell wall biosynthesis
MPAPSAAGRPKRIDLHCHSDASNKTSEAVLNAMRCPESYSRPEDVYAQARARGMDFVTITDHDSIEGVLEIAQRPDVLVGEELTCWFPEDHCKMHVLVFGITREDHDVLQSRARNIYDVADYIERNRIAHAVAHPIYRQNDKLERWHLERLMLLFKGFECLNGSHSSLHREAFEPVLNKLTRQEIQRLSETHGLLPRWPEPWFKARTAGSDDHGLLNIGRTYTEFPPHVTTAEEILQCLREGRCQPAGEAGSSAKLAHMLYSVGMRYYSRHIMSPDAKPNFATALLQTLVGERKAPAKTELIAFALRHKLKKLGAKLKRPFFHPAAADVNPEEREGTALVKRLFLKSARKRIGEHATLLESLERELPPLGEHGEMFQFAAEINRDVSRGIAAAIRQSIHDARFVGLFDAISAAMAQQFLLLPYYFAVFHQNKERHLLRKITGQQHFRGDRLRVGLFSDTFDEVNGVARFIRDMGLEAHRQGRNLTVHTCSDKPLPPIDGVDRKNFEPLLSRPLPYYPQLTLSLPPVLEVLEWADRQQFDAIHISTPGPMGLCGWLVSKMLRVPLLATFHTDLPAYAEKLTGDHRITRGTRAYVEWLHKQAAVVFSRSSAYRFKLMDFGIAEEKIRVIPAGINLEKFNGTHRDETLFARLGVAPPLRLLYVGRISVEKNLPLLVEAFKQLCTMRRDAALIVAGEGPYLATMRQELSGLPAHFLGFQNDQQLGPLYASSDLFVFPSRTDTLGQVVMEALASGLPAIVSNEGGPKDNVEHDESALVLPATDPAVWCTAMNALLSDAPRRQRMSRHALQRAKRFSLQASFTALWTEHVTAIEGPAQDETDLTLPLTALS